LTLITSCIWLSLAPKGSAVMDGLNPKPRAVGRRNAGCVKFHAHGRSNRIDLIIDLARRKKKPVEKKKKKKNKQNNTQSKDKQKTKQPKKKNPTPPRKEPLTSAG